MWFEKVRGGSTCWNHPELVHKHPAHLASTVKTARCVEFLHMSSGWFDSTELSLTTFTMEARCAGCLCTSSGWFKHVEPPRTFSNYSIAEMARCIEFFHMSSGWFDSTELSLTTSLEWKQVVQGAYALVRGGSSTSNFLEPSRTTALQRWQGMSSFFT